MAMGYDIDESRRAREFYRYYEPIRMLSKSGPTYCELGDETARNAHMPCSSPDKALTAFCQLGALRLGTRRSMLFFFDESYAYVLAEATRTLSLEDDSKHEIDDSLWLGHTVIPRGFSVCEHTVRMDISSLSKAEDPPQVHIINDLKESTKFCDRPFVTSGPRARFYAGSPITTPEGVNIGAFCVLDDKPRENGLARKDIVFLREMANTIMTHLNMARAKDDQRRGLKMTNALSKFIDNEYTDSDHGRHDQPSANQVNGTSPVRTEPEEPKGVPRRVQSNGSSTPSNGTTNTVQPSPSHTSGLPMRGSATHDYGVSAIQEDAVPRMNRATFQKAAELVMAATEVDGTIYLEASKCTFGGIGRTSDTDCGGRLDFSKGSAGRSHLDTPISKMAGRSCVVLGAAGNPHEIEVSNGFLGSLLEKYGKRGKTWSFDSNLAGSSGDEMSDLSPSETLAAETTAPRILRKDRKDETRQSEMDEIQRLVPGVRNLAIHGLWDESRARWYAACMTWTYSPLRVFSASERNYIAAFCDVILAEVRRHEVQDDNKAKADFISSISHELRSPLHGILGSVECMQDMAEFGSSSKELEQINTCAHTLLDIVDHLLDASMISFSKPKATHGLSTLSANAKSKLSPNSDSTSTGLRTLSENVSLAAITEATVDTVVYAFSCRKDKQEQLCNHLTVSMHIDDFDKPRWNVLLPTGAYRRIVINLVSNALKYTSSGWISIALRAEDLLVTSHDQSRRFNAVLTVSDSGRGMSQEYLQNSAFRAFSQEDSFVEGTGLGLNLVANILKQLGGKIDIQSEKNVGTRVTVTLPLQYAAGSVVKVASAPVVGVTATSDEKLGTTAESLLSTDREDTAGLDVSAEVEVISPKSVRSGFASNDTSKSQSSAAKDEAKQSSDEDNNDKSELKSVPTSLYRPQVGIILGDHDTGRMATANDFIKANLESACLQMGLRPLESTTLHSSHGDLNIISELVALKEIQQAIAGGNTVPVTAKPLVIVTRTARSERLLKAQPRLIAQLTSSSIVEYVQSYWALGLAKAVRKCLSPETDTPTHEYNEDGQTTNISSINSTLQALALSSALPVDKVDQGAKRSRLGKTNTPKAVPLHTNLRLLIVDDNPINVQILVTYARKQGYVNSTANNGEEAVLRYKEAYQPGQESPPLKHKIVLMDLNMPLMDGYEAARHIREYELQHELAPAHIIALTGLGSAVAQQEAFESGMDVFLTKPVSLKELKRLIGEICASSPR